MKPILYLICTILLLTNQSKGESSASSISIDDNLPTELNLLIKSVERGLTKKEDLKHFLNTLKSLNESLSCLLPSQLLFLVKSEIYQNILKIEWNNILNSSKRSTAPLDQYLRLLNKKQGNLSPLSQQIYKYILKDLKLIRDNKKIKNRQRKMEMISPWLLALQTIPGDRIESHLATNYFDTLVTFKLKTETFKRLTEKKADNKKTFFKFDESIVQRNFDERIANNRDGGQSQTIGLKKKAEKSKKDAQQLIKKISIDPTKTKMIKEKRQKKGWIPK